MLQVSYQITIGQEVYTNTDVLDVRSHSGFHIPVNTCRCILTSPNNIKVIPDDALKVELGYENQQTLVFTGKVSHVDWEIDRVNIIAESSFSQLTLTRLNLIYEKSNAGDIVEDIAQKRLKLPISKVEPGLQFPVYVVGDRLSTYNHLQTLSQQCGFDFYANTQDALVFAKPQIATTHECEYGVNILSCDLHQPKTAITGVDIYGESPASQGQGQQAYSWLTKKAIKGIAGDHSGTKLRLTDPTTRTQQLADKVAQAMFENRRQKLRGVITVLGTPQISLGDAIKISQMPMNQLNRSFKVTSVSHSLNRDRGFSTKINWEEI